jgi:MFS family permease
MAGARRQIFIAFAVLLLVQKFQYSVQEIAILFVINNAINYFLSPAIGRAIIRFGERKVLSLEYSCLIAIFITYALTGSKLVVAILYILDHIFFNFSIAIKTYFQKVGEPEDAAPSMAVGFTINHIAAVVLPAIGGLLWVMNYRIPFYAGAVMSQVSLTAVQLIREPPKAAGYPQTPAMAAPQSEQAPSLTRTLTRRNPQRSMTISPHPGQRVFSPASPGTFPV